MPKRERAQEDEGNAQPSAKKVRSVEPAKSDEATVTINNARDLQRLLTFHQDTKELKASIRNFKSFLHTIVYPEDGQLPNKENLACLKEYLLHQKPLQHEDEQPIYISDLVQTWIFASEKNDDNLFSAAASIIALLLKTISTEIDLKDYGLGICRTVLQHRQTKLLQKGCTAPKHKEHVISPCYRLLTEVVSFDGGTLGRQVYSKRDQLFEPKVIARNLGLARSTRGDAEGTPRRPTVRSNVLRYVLANLKFQNEGVKIDILKQSNVISAFFNGLVDDSSAVIAEALAVIQNHIVHDRNIPRTSKRHIFGDRSLRALASLYRVGKPDELVDGTGKTILQVVHEFMLHICTSSAGALMETNVNVAESSANAEHEDDLSFAATTATQAEVVDEQDYTIARVNVRNQALANFAQTLRPYANPLEKELLLAILKAAPELVADYWLKKENFSYEPKLTTTWIGYSAFIFATIQLPLPTFISAPDSRPLHPRLSYIVLESILPLPLNNKTLKKCFNAHTPLISLIAARTLILAIEKLKTVVAVYRKIDENSSSTSWLQASRVLVSDFGRRCPPMKDIIDTFRRTADRDVIQREAITRLLSLYYEILPHLAFAEKFDISLALSIALQRADSLLDQRLENALLLLDLSHLVKIARNSSEMNWWKRPERLRFSPILTTLLVGARLSGNVSGDSLEHLLTTIVEEKGFLQCMTTPSALQAFVQSLKALSSENQSAGLLAFVDDCLGRYAAKPIVYEDQFDAFLVRMSTEKASMAPVSIWTMTLLEQWRFVESKRSADAVPIATWLQNFLQALLHCGEDQDFIHAIMDEMHRSSAHEAVKAILVISESKGQSSLANTSTASDRNQHDNISQDCPPDDNFENTFDLRRYYATAPVKTPNFVRFKNSDVDALLNSNALMDLLLSMSSEEAPIRLQAISALQHFMIKLQGSYDSDRDMSYIIIGELVETAQQHQRERIAALPFLVTTFAAEALQVMRDPTHVMYPKVATFVNTRPHWSPFKLVREFLNLVVLSEPAEESDSAPWRECAWVLNWLLNGLRTLADCEVLRQVGAWETIAGLGAHPALAYSIATDNVATVFSIGKTQDSICNGIVHLFCRAVILGDASTLATRVGGLVWLDSWQRLGRIDEKLAKGLRRAILAQEHERLSKWSFGLIDGHNDHEP